MISNIISIFNNPGMSIGEKILYLAMMDITKKWTGKSWAWGQTLDQLCIYFGDRIQPGDL